jgi:hypothetical protein
MIKPGLAGCDHRDGLNAPQGVEGNLGLELSIVEVAFQPGPVGLPPTPKRPQFNAQEVFTW